MSLINFKEMISLSVPKQHGAWISIFACFALGLMVADRIDFKSILLLISVIAGFLLRYNLSTAIKNSNNIRYFVFPTVFYFLVFILSGLILLFYYRLTMLIPLGIVPAVSAVSYLYFEKIRKPNSVGSEIMGMLGISTVAPASYYVALSRFDTHATGIWIVSMLFFLCSIFIVRYLVRDKLRYRTEYTKLAAAPFTVCFGSVILIYLLGRVSFLPAYAFVSIIPSLIIFFMLSVTKKSLSIKKIGLVSTINVTLFVILFAISFI